MALLRVIRESPYTLIFVDPAVVSHEARVTSAASISGPIAVKSEQAVIALALLDEARNIFIDSKAMIRALASVSVTEEGNRILDGRVMRPHTITWLPVHLDSQLDSFHSLNDITHVQARAL
ncbi:hypothetical protein HPB52_013363 [Rhipicephalus sanguineus]|uniref:Uncharacterized protein n=1 Tax=Rhipicephalus sanguineus TaxID=34632 RepID=A0A9D4PP57_RHISA|nr:hypothetical protein HPB52_013363 [Rhipicephalus sanguineus]